MIYNKMEILIKRRFNRWDNDSIRPGPVGSVGDTNVQVMLRKSAVDMPERFDPTFSGKNAEWSGSNVSDGSYLGWTSGGGSATVISKALPNFQTGGKTNVGWVTQNIVAADRTRETKLTPLGRYGWDTTVGSVVRAKTTGDYFLPLPGGYEKQGLTRGSQFPRVIAESMGEGVALPAADVNLTDPVFGETGTIEIDQPACSKEDIKKVYTPEADDPVRQKPLDMFNKKYPWRTLSPPYNQYPPIGDNIEIMKYVWKGTGNKPEAPRLERVTVSTSPCGAIDRPLGAKLPTRKETVPKPGNQDKRNQDKKKDQEDEKKKKQKMR
jgi:hypothetical protein